MNLNGIFILIVIIFIFALRYRLRLNNKKYWMSDEQLRQSESVRKGALAKDVAKKHPQLTAYYDEKIKEYSERWGDNYEPRLCRIEYLLCRMTSEEEFNRLLNEINKHNIRFGVAITHNEEIGIYELYLSNMDKRYGQELIEQMGIKCSYMPIIKKYGGIQILKFEKHIE